MKYEPGYVTVLCYWTERIVLFQGIVYIIICLNSANFPTILIIDFVLAISKE